MFSPNEADFGCKSGAATGCLPQQEKCLALMEHNTETHAISIPVFGIRLYIGSDRAIQHTWRSNPLQIKGTWAVRRIERPAECLFANNKAVGFAALYIDPLGVRTDRDCFVSVTRRNWTTQERYGHLLRGTGRQQCKDQQAYGQAFHQALGRAVFSGGLKNGQAIYPA